MGVKGGGGGRSQQRERMADIWTQKDRGDSPHFTKKERQNHMIQMKRGGGEMVGEVGGGGMR